MAQQEDKDRIIADLKSWNILNDIYRMCKDQNSSMTWDQVIKTLLGIITKSPINRQPDLMYKNDKNRAKNVDSVRKMMREVTRDVPISPSDEDVLVQATVYLALISRETNDELVGLQIRCGADSFYNITDACVIDVAQKYLTNEANNPGGRGNGNSDKDENGGNYNASKAAASGEMGESHEEDQTGKKDDDDHQGEETDSERGGSEGGDADGDDQNEDGDEENQDNEEGGSDD